MHLFKLLCSLTNRHLYLPGRWWHPPPPAYLICQLHLGTDVSKVCVLTFFLHFVQMVASTDPVRILFINRHYEEGRMILNQAKLAHLIE